MLKPVYSHRTGEFEPPVYVKPSKFLVVEGLLSFHTETLRSLHDVRVALAPPEELRRAWKLKRDCTRRGYTTDEVLAELDLRQSDAEEFVVPQRRYADIVVAFSHKLDADVILRDTLPHPDLSRFSTEAVRASSSGRGSGFCEFPAISTPGTPQSSRRRSGRR